MIQHKPIPQVISARNAAQAIIVATNRAQEQGFPRARVFAVSRVGSAHPRGTISEYRVTYAVESDGNEVGA